MRTGNKILIISNSISGLHSFRAEVVKAFVDKGFTVTILSRLGDPRSVKCFEEMGCKVIGIEFFIHGTNPVADISLMRKFKKIIRSENPSVVFTYTIKPNVYGGIACALCGVPQIANITGLGAAVEHPGILQNISIMLYRIGLRKTNLVFFQNEFNRTFCLEHRMVRGKSKMIPGSGVNLTFHSLQEFPPEDEPVRFLFIGRIRQDKGIDEYIAAAEHFYSLRDKYKTEWHVLGGGEPEYEERIKELSGKGVICYHGFQYDVRPYIAEVQCGIHPSFYPEGMSNVLQEYCAAGRAIIATDRPGCKEIVEDGVNGFLIRQRDAEDLIEKVQSFLALPYEKRKEMGLAARAKVEREFSREVVVKAYLDAVNEL